MSEKSVSLFYRIFRNPIAMRELRVSGRSLRIWIVYLVALLAQFIMVLVVASDYTNDGVIRVDQAMSIGRNLFQAECAILLAIILAVVPAFSFRALVVERDNGSFDMLMLSHLRPWEIILGKFVSALAQCSLFILSSLPVFGLAYAFGGIPPVLLAVVLFAYFVLATGLSAISIYFSTITKRPLAALILSYGAAIGIGFLTAAAGAALLFNTLIRGGTSPLELIQDGDENVRMVVFLFGIALLCLTFAFSFISATSRIKTESENKWTPLRIFQSVAALTAIGLVFAMIPLANSPLVRDEVNAGALQTAVAVIVALFSVPLVFSLTKPITDATFPARSVYRRFKEKQKQARAPMKLVRWLYLPGATSSLALGAVLAAVVLGCCFVASTFVYAQPPASAMGGHPMNAWEDESRAWEWLGPNAPQSHILKAESALYQDWAGSQGFVDTRRQRRAARERGGEQAVIELQGRENAIQSAPMGSPTSPAGVVQPSAKQYPAMIREMFAQQIWMLVAIAASIFVLYLCLGTFSWGLAFTSFPRRVITLMALVALLVMTFLPMLFSALSADFPLLGQIGGYLRKFSPFTLWQACIGLGHVEAMDSLSLSKHSSELISGARWSTYWSILQCWIALGIFMLIGLLIGLPRRRAAMVARAEAHDRWPVPVLPPPRQIVLRRPHQPAGGDGPLDAALGADPSAMPPSDPENPYAPPAK